MSDYRNRGSGVRDRGSRIRNQGSRGRDISVGGAYSGPWIPDPWSPIPHCQIPRSWRIMYPSAGVPSSSGAVTMPFTLTVNGRSRTVDVPADMPLLWVLRDVLDLKGTKYGCSVSQCSACTVHVNGQPTRSCSVPTSKRTAHDYRRSLDRGTHPLRRAWQRSACRSADMRQAGRISVGCGTPREAAPTDIDIDTAVGGSICRCGTCIRIRRAIHRAAAGRGGRQRSTGVAHHGQHPFEALDRRSFLRVSALGGRGITVTPPTCPGWRWHRRLAVRRHRSRRRVHQHRREASSRSWRRSRGGPGRQDDAPDADCRKLDVDGCRA